MLPRLHVVTDDQVLAATDFPEQAASIISELGQNVALHLRSHSLSSRRLYQLAAGLGQQAGAIILINDRVDVACAARAAGAQLPWAGLPPAAARRILGNRWIGCSVHDAQAATARAQGADFLLAGSIYETASHPELRPAGPDLLRALQGTQTCPLIAIGGINAQRVSECLAAGAYGIAVIRAVWQAQRPALAARELLDRLQTSIVKS